MNRRLARLALCFAAALLVVVPVNGQRTRRAPAKPPAAPASLSGSPAASFPAGTMFYAEVSDTASGDFTICLNTDIVNASFLLACPVPTNISTPNPARICSWLK